jgi:predicted transcriptional regulator
MRRSKQEIYADILRVLAFDGASKPTQLAYKAKVNTQALNQCLNYLCQQNLVEKRTIRKKLTYAVTKKGWRVIKSRENTPFSLQPIVCYSLRTSDSLKEKGCTS